MRVSWIILFLFFSLVTLASPLSAQDWKQAVENDYRDKIFFLRGFYQDDSLHFDQNGAPTKGGHTGSWTTCGIYIESVWVQKQTLVFDGRRIVEVGDASGMHPARTKSKVRITIDLPDTDEQAVRESLSKVFVDPRQPIIDWVPDYWRDVLQHNPVTELIGPPKNVERKQPCTTAGTVDAPCKVGGIVQPPTPIRSPDPKYPEIARRNHYEGTPVLWLVVNETGTPTKIRLAKAVGFGLDDEAVSAVREWRFHPATRDGKPVAVQINVEINFRL